MTIRKFITINLEGAKSLPILSLSSFHSYFFPPFSSHGETCPFQENLGHQRVQSLNTFWFIFCVHFLVVFGNIFNRLNMKHTKLLTTISNNDNSTSLTIFLVSLHHKQTFLNATGIISTLCEYFAIITSITIDVKT